MTITKRPFVCHVGCVIISALLSLPASSSANILNFLFGRPELETITVTDMYPASALRRTPTPGNPVYYAAVSGGYRDLGVSKPGEKVVPRKMVTDTMLKVLAKQGYLPVAAGRHPDIVLVWHWGTFNAQIFRTGERAFYQNRSQLVRFMGGDKVGLNGQANAFSTELLMPGSFVFGYDAQRIYDVAGDDLYIAVITAYDANSKDAKDPIRLWSTRVATPSRGFYLDEALPNMMAMAAPFIGRDTPKPVWIGATDKFRPEIKLGDTKLVDYIQSSANSVVDVGASK